MGMVGNRSFTLSTESGKWRGLPCLKDGVPQESVFASLFLNIYTSDLPTTVSRKYAYADELSVLLGDGDWQTVERVMSKDIATAREYLHTWKLKLNTTKTVTAVFHLNNKEAKCELKVNHNKETLPFCSKPKYLAVTSARTLTHRRHLESLCNELTSRWFLFDRRF